MILVDSIKTFGEYILLMKRVMAQPERWRVFFRRMLHEMYQLGVNSIPIVLLISFFIGAVICIQLKLNIESPWMPKMVVGYSTREILILEFSSSIMCLILAGKVGSNITSEIGTMRVSKLRKFPYTSKNHSTYLNDSHACDIQHRSRNSRCIRNRQIHRNNDPRRPYGRIAI